jgi:hypothetical protein
MFNVLMFTDLHKEYRYTMSVHRASFFGLGLGVVSNSDVNLKFPENIASLSGVHAYRKINI